MISLGNHKGFQNSTVEIVTHACMLTPAKAGPTLWQSKCEKNYQNSNSRVQKVKAANSRVQKVKAANSKVQKVKAANSRVQKVKATNSRVQKIKAVNSKVQKYRGQIYLCVHTTTIIKYLWGNKLVVK